MATKAVGFYPRIGMVDGQQTGIIQCPDVDAAHFVAPGANGTWTNYTGAEVAAQTAQAAAGYIVVNMAGVLYRLPAYLTT